jgi:hypothetical protein
VYPPDPPLTVMSAVPSQALKQVTLVDETSVTVGDPAFGTLTVTVIVQLFASPIVQV